MTRKQRQPASVGEILKQEFLIPLNIPHDQLAMTMGVNRQIVDDIVNGADIEANQAKLLADSLGTSSEFWLNLQNHVDLYSKSNTQ